MDRFPAGHRRGMAGLCSCGFQGGCVLNKSHVSGEEHLKVWISMNKKDQTSMNLHGWRLATHTPRTPQLKYTYNSARVQIRRVQSNSYDSNIKSKSSFTNLHSWHFFHFRYLHRVIPYPPSAPPDAWVQRRWSENISIQKNSLKEEAISI